MMNKKPMRADEWLLGRFKRRFSKRQWMTLFGGHPNPLGGGAGVVVDVELNLTCPAITPTLGAELLANPGFEGTYNAVGALNIAPNWANTNCETDGTDTLAESTDAHGGSKAQLITVNANAEGIQSAAGSLLPSIGWYQISLWVKLTSGTVRICDADFIFGPNVASAGAYAQMIGTGKTGGANKAVLINQQTAGSSIVDDASAKAISLASMLTLLGSRSAMNGTYICHPTVADFTQAGMAVCYASATNFVLAVVDRSSLGKKAILYSFINGTWATVITGAITYVAAAELKVVVSGTSFSLYYNGAQVGTTQTIATGTFGTAVYGFNAFAGNAVGVVTTSP